MGGPKSAKDLLERLRILGETECIEAKRGSSISRSIMETVCAFSNEPGLGGGNILLGIEEEDGVLIPSYPAIGVRDVDKLTNDLLSQCRTMFNVALAPRISPEEIEGKIILNVEVPEAPLASKPIYFQSDGLPRGAYRRTSSGDIRCTDDDLVIFFDGRSQESFDSNIIERAEWEDIDPDAIEDYRRERSKASPEAEELLWSDQDLLYALDCVRKINGFYKPTVAGILLFGTKVALRRLFPMMRVDYIRVNGKEWIPDPHNRFESIDMRDPIMRLVRRTLAAIYEDFTQPFSLPEGEIQRQTTQPIPPRALREAVVNAVMHRSYRSESPIQIIRYVNRVEIRNPGYSLKNEERWGEPRSLNRNPKISSVLHETRFAETKGSGMRVMRDLMVEAGLTPPFFESDRSGDSFVATFLMHHFLSEDDVKWLGGFKEFNLSAEEARALIWVRESGGQRGAINNAVYRNLNSVDTLNASTHLRRLRDAQILVLKGRGNTAYYVPGPIFIKIQEAWESNLSTNSIKVDDVRVGVDDIRTGVSGVGTGVDNIKAGVSDVRAGAMSVIDSLVPIDVNALSRLEIISLLPGELATAVKQLGQRTTADNMRSIILRLCELRYWRSEELAMITNRRPDKFIAKYITPMVKLGLLERLYPEIPNHPLQAYRTARKKESK